MCDFRYHHNPELKLARFALRTRRERLKRAIANASEAVARARAKNSHVLKKANIIKGGDGGAKAASPMRASIVKAAPKVRGGARGAAH